MNEDALSAILARYQSDPGALLPILQEASAPRGYLTEETMRQIARGLDLSPAEVYGVASFYSFLRTRPRGRHLIQICGSLTCELREGKQILAAVTRHLKIAPGETSPDGFWSLETVSCLGWCHKGPAMLIDGKIHTELDPETALEILEDERHPEAPRDQ